MNKIRLLLLSLFAFLLFGSNTYGQLDFISTNLNPAQTNCETATFRFTTVDAPAAPIVAGQWHINRGAGGIVVIPFGDPTFGQPSATFLPAGLHTVWFSYSTNGTTFTTVTKQVQVFDYADVSININSALASSGNIVSGCVPFTANFQGFVSADPNVASIISWEWNFGDGNTSSLQNPTHTYTTTSTSARSIQLTVTTSTGCQTVYQVNNVIQVNPLPIANFNNQLGCTIPFTANFTDLSIMPSGPGIPVRNIVARQWFFGDGTFSSATNPSKIYTAYGDYNVFLTVTSQNGCQSTFSRIIGVHNNVSNFTTALPSACQNVPFQFNNASLGFGTVTPTSWAWNFGDATTSNVQNPSKTYTAVGAKVVTLLTTFSDGCTNTVIKNLDVLGSPNPAFTASSTSECKIPAFITLTPTTPAAGNTYQWTISDGVNTFISTGQGSAYAATITAYGTYNVTLLVTNAAGCQQTLTQPNMLNITPPKADFNVNSNWRGCAPFIANLFTSVSSLKPITTYGWEFISGASIINHNVVTANTASPALGAGIYDVRLTVSTADGCTFTTIKPAYLYVAALPVINNVIISRNNGAGECRRDVLGNGISFAPVITGTADSLVWDWQDAWDDVNSFYTGRESSYSTNSPNDFTTVFLDRIGTFIPTLRAYRYGCPTPTFNVGGGGGVTILGPIVRFNASTTVGCGGNPNITFTNRSHDGAGGATYNINFGDGSAIVPFASAGNIVHAYLPGDYTVFVTGINAGCTDVSSVNVRVTNVSAISFISASNICRNVTTANFNGTFNPNPPRAVTHSWSFVRDNGGSFTTVFNVAGQNISQNFPQPGNYLAIYRATETNGSGCVFTTTSSFLVRGPDANFTTAAAGFACEGVPVTFKDISVPFNTAILTSTWTMGDGTVFTTATGHEFNHTYATMGTKNISLLVTDGSGCVHTRNLAFDVRRPTANFDFAAANFCVGSPVSFTNTSTGVAPITYEWELNNDFTTIESTAVSPTPTFTSAGFYNIRLTATDGNGCKHNVVKGFTIHPQPNTFISVTTHAINASRVIVACPSQPVGFATVSTTPDATTYYWEFGDGFTSNLAKPNPHRYAFPGSYTVKLTIGTAAGCLNNTQIVDFISVDGPIGDFVYNKDRICYPEEVFFTAGQTAATPFLTALSKYSKVELDFGDGSVGVIQFSTSAVNPSSFTTSHIYTKPGVFYPILTLIDNSNCRVAYPTKIPEIRSSGYPTSQFQMNYNQVCTNVAVSLTNQSTIDPLTNSHPQRALLTPDIAVYDWRFITVNPIGNVEMGVASTANTANPNFTFATSGNYKVQLTVYSGFNNAYNNALGCPSVSQQFITVVDPMITAAFTANVTEGCPFTTVIFNATASKAFVAGVEIPKSQLRFSWDFGDGTMLSGIGLSFITPTHTYTQPRNKYPVTLSIQDIAGCAGQDAKSDVIWIYNTVAEFTPFTTSGLRPLTVTFVDFLTVGTGSWTDNGTINHWQWNFPQGSPSMGSFTSSPTPPAVTFSARGSHAIFLTAYTNQGCFATVTHFVTVLNNPPFITTFALQGAEDNVLNFTTVLFGTQGGYGDPDTDPFTSVLINSLPLNGTLRFGGTPVIVGQVFSTAQLPNLNFTPNLNFNGITQFDWVAYDDQNFNSVSMTRQVIMSFDPRNDPPVVTNVDRGTYPENTTVFISVSHFVPHYSDPVENTPMSKIQITELPLVARGTLEFTTNNGVNWDPVVLNQQFQTADLLNGGFRFVPAVDGYNGFISGTISPQFRWNGADGLGVYALNSAFISINYQNTAPVITDLNKQEHDEDTTVPFTTADFFTNFSDIDVTDDLEFVTITSLPNNGTLHFNSVAITVNQSIPKVDLDKITFTPQLNFNGNVQFAWRARDIGTVGGNVGTLNRASNTANVFITIRPVADHPFVTTYNKLPIAETTFTTTTFVQFTSADFGTHFSDPDHNNPNPEPLNRIRIESLPLNGTLVRFDGTNFTTIVISDEIPSANLNQIRFYPNQFFNGTTSFGWNGSDGTTSGLGQGYALQMATAFMTVVPTPNPPFVTTYAKPAVPEDTDITFTAANFAAYFSDPDNEPLTRIKIVSLPLNGTLFITGNPLNSLPIGGLELLTVNINPANFFFRPNQHWNGTTEFSWNGSDGVVALPFSDGYALITAKVFMTVTPVPDPPVVQDINKNPVLENTTITYTISDFTNKFIDPDLDPLVKIQVRSLPLNGTLFLTGNPISNNQEIPVAQLSGITFVPALNWNGNTTWDWNGSDFTTASPGGYALQTAQVFMTVTPVNNPPAIGDINKVGLEDQDILITLANFNGVPVYVNNGQAFSDPDSDLLKKIVVLSLPINGTLKYNNVPVAIGQEFSTAQLTANNLIFTPNLHWNGNTQFDWNAHDGTFFATAFDQVFITITAQNDLPVVADIYKSGVVNTTIPFATVDYTSRFTDPDNDPMTKIKVLSLPLNGTLFLTGNPILVNQEIATANLLNITFVPALNWTGNTEFIWNGFDGTNYALQPDKVFISVSPLQATRPTVADIFKSGPEDTPVPFTQADFTSKFTDPEGDALQKIRVINLPANGILKLNGIDVFVGQEIATNQLNQLAFIPNLNWNGNTQFDWNGSDANNYALVNEQVFINIVPANDPPVVADINKDALPENTTFNYAQADFTAKFTDLDGDALNKIRVVSLPLNGTLKLGVDFISAGQEIPLGQLNTITFVPNTNFNGQVQWDWNGSDGNLYAAQFEQVFMTITPVQQIPTVADIYKSGPVNQPIPLSITDFTSKFNDPDNDPLSKIQIGSVLPPNGTLFLTGNFVSANQEIPVSMLNGLSFMPNFNWTGGTQFNWNGHDGTTYAAVAEQVFISVFPYNTRPVVADVNKGALPENTTFAYTLADFTSKFTDPETDPLNKIKVVSLPNNGLLKLNGINIGIGQEIASVDIAQMTFVPNTNFNGQVQWDWNGSDGQQFASVYEQVFMTINAVNKPPVVTPIVKTQVQTVNISFVTADFQNAFSDPDGNPLSRIEITTLPTNGTLFLTGNAVTIGQVITTTQLNTAAGLYFTPNPTFETASVISFAWKGGDATLFSTASTAGLSYYNVPPVVQDINKGNHPEDTTVPFAVSDFTDRFVDPHAPHDVLTTVKIVSLPNNGFLKLNGVNATVGQEIPTSQLGNLTFVPNLNFNGQVQFDWNGSDGTAFATIFEQVFITIVPVNDRPVVADIYKNPVPENTNVLFNIGDFASKFTDIDGDPLVKIQVVSLPLNGTLFLTGNAVSMNQEIPVAQIPNLIFTPTPYWNGLTQWNWNGSDGSLYALIPEQVFMTITPVNDPPFVTTYAKNPVLEDTDVVFAVADFTSKFSDPEGSPLNRIRIEGLPLNGTLKLAGVPVTVGQEIPAANLNTLVFTPNSNWNGNTVFDWNGSDGSTSGLGQGFALITAKAFMTVTPQQDVPAVADIHKSGVVNATIPFVSSNFTTRFTDPDNDPLVNVRVESLPLNGTLFLSGNFISVNQVIPTNQLSQITFVPNTNWTGNTEFIWNGFDGTTYAPLSDKVYINIVPVSTPPTVADLYKNGVEDTPIPFAKVDFTSRFFDPTSDPLSKIQVLSLPNNGILKLNGVDVLANQEIPENQLHLLSFIPNSQWNGTTQFNWNGSDGGNYAVQFEQVFITVTPVPDPPVVADINKGAQAENTNFTITLAGVGDFDARFSDPDADILQRVRIVTLPNNGTLFFTGNPVTLGQEITRAALVANNLIFTPQLNFNGQVQFDWNGSDGTTSGLGQGYALQFEQVFMTINSVQNLPVVADIYKSGLINTVIPFNITDFTSKFTDPDNDPLTKIRIGAVLPLNGTLFLTGNPVGANQEIPVELLGNLTFMPALNWTGNTQFDWNGHDGISYAAVQEQVFISVFPTSNRPVVADINKGALPENTVFTFTTANFTSKFTDADNDPMIKAQIVSLPSNGILKLNGVNVFVGQEIQTAFLTGLTFTPNLNFNGQVFFDWNGSDGSQYALLFEQVFMTITPVNNIPSINPIAKSQVQDNTITLNLVDFTNTFSDPDGQPMKQVEILTLPTNGTLSRNAAAVTLNQVFTTAELTVFPLIFTPNLGFESATVFDWRASDGTDFSSSTKATLTYYNLPPAVGIVNKVGPEDTPVPFTVVDFTSQFTDPNAPADVMTKAKIVTLPVNGVLQFNGVPVVAGQEILTAQLANLVFIPAPNWNGTTQFDWNGFDGTVFATANGKVFITITPTPDLPVVADINKVGLEDTPVPFATVDFTSKFTDPDGDLMTKMKVLSLPANGTLLFYTANVIINQEINTADLVNLTFVPNLHWNGNTQFDWNGFDGTSFAAQPEQVFITITPVPDRPVVTMINKVGPQNVDINFTTADFVTRFTDPDNDALQFISVSGIPVANGTLFLTGNAVTDGQVITLAQLNTGAGLYFTPNLNWNGGVNGNTLFQWNGSDGGLFASANANVFITIVPTSPNPPFVTVINKGNHPEDTTVPFAVADFTSKFSDPDNDLLQQVRIVSLPNNGSLRLNGVPVAASQDIPTAQLNQLTFVPNANFNGQVEFDWNGSDGTQFALVTAKVFITITSQLDPPVVLDINKGTFAEETTVYFTSANFIPRFSDPDNDILTSVRIESLPNGGTLTFNSVNVAAGQVFTTAQLNQLVFVPNPNFNGQVRFSWNGSDGTTSGLGQGYALLTANIFITITPQPDLPDVMDINKFGLVNTTVTFNINDFTNRFTDPDGGALVQMQVVNLPANGLLFLTGQLVPVGQIINTADIANLQFLPNLNWTGTTNFDWNGRNATGFATASDKVNITISNAPVTFPVVADINKIGAEDVPIPFSTAEFTNKFSDPENQTLVQIQVLSLPTNGTLQLNGVNVTTNQVIPTNQLNLLSFIPNANWNGNTQFNWNGSDGGNYAQVFEQVFITVYPNNDPPIALDDAQTTNMNTPLTVNAASGALNDGVDTDPDGNTALLQVTPITNATTTKGGKITLNPNGSYTYNPPLNFVGLDTYIYQVCDAGTPKACANATIRITVLPVNLPPVASNDAVFTTINKPVNGTLVGKYNDPDGTAFISAGTFPTANGSITINPNGTYTYTPNNNFVGTDNHQYRVCDNGMPVYCTNAFITIVVGNNAPFNRPPVATTDLRTTPRNIPISGSVLPNDNDPDGDAIVVTTTGTFTTQKGGSLILNGNGTFTYTPPLNFVGNDSYPYTICDNGIPVLCNSAYLFLTVTPKNDPPVGVDDFVTTIMNAPVVTGKLLPNDSDPNGDPITTNVVTNVTTLYGGTISIDANGNYNYTPPRGYTGIDKYVYTLCDNGTPALCATAILHIKIDPVPEPPVANNDYNSTPMNTTLFGTNTILGNDFDPNNDPLIATFVTAATTLNGGKITINTDGTYIYTPATGFVGTDQYTYTVCENKPAGLCATAKVIITVGTTNRPPLAPTDVFVTNEDTPISNSIKTNDSDPDVGNTLTYTNVTNVLTEKGGRITIDANGNFTYTPLPNTSGTDRYIYTVCDNLGACTQGVVVINITPVNDPPVAQHNQNTTNKNTPINGTVILNDYDIEDDPISVTPFASVATTQGGLITINPNGTYTYTPKPNFFGNDTYVYQLCDNAGACVNATLFITVNNVITPPKANDDRATTPPNVPVVIKIQDNDVNPDGGTLTSTIVRPPANGVVVINPNGTHTYTPNTGFKGFDNYQYQICDLHGNCSVATVIIDVNQEVPPVAVDDFNRIPQGATATGSVLANDRDLQGYPITVTPINVTIPSLGTLVIYPNGNYEFKPFGTFAGTFVYPYTVCNNKGLCATANLNIQVDPINMNPVAVTDKVTTPEDTPVSGNLMTNDYDLNNGKITIKTEPVVNPQNGKIVINKDGTFVYTPNPNFYGLDSAKYQICDDGVPLPVLCATGTLYITVTSINDAPIAKDDNNFTSVNQPIGGTMANNDFDVDVQDKLVYTTVPINPPSNGKVVINPNGTYTYTPNKNFVGNDKFTYQVCDTGIPVLCANATVFITVGDKPNRPTVAVDDRNLTEKNKPVSGSMIDNDSDPDSDPITVNTTPVVQPKNGMVVINPNGTYTYTPNKDYTGTDQFTYQICDERLACATAVVTITIPAPPFNNVIAGADKEETQQDKAINANVIFNDYDPQGDQFSVKGIVTQPKNGAVVMNPNGTYTYTPNKGFTGEDTFEYQICDSKGACTTAIVTITVKGKPKPAEPNITNVTDRIKGDAPLGGTLPTIDGVLGTGLFTGVTPFTTITGNGGTFGIDQFGKYTYVAAPCFFGTEVFYYTVCDNSVPVNCYTKTITITVEKVEYETPRVPDIIIEGKLNEKSLSEISKFFELKPNWEITPIVNGNTALRGNFKLNANGAFEIMPSQIFGKDSMYYTICDKGRYSACTPCGVGKIIFMPKGDATFIPNGFSPNGDGDQDTWTLPSISGKKVSVRIYNRYGNVVFESDDYKNDWNGKANRGVLLGNELPDATYYFIIDFEGDRKRAGFITLRR